LLRVSVQLLPHGDQAQAREIARMEIVNTGDHPERPHKGNYTVRVVTHTPATLHVTQRRVLNHDRLRYNVWALVLAALTSMGPDALELENPDGPT
jgi:hypothetical protein